MAEKDFRSLSEEISSFCLVAEARSGTQVIQPFPRSPKLIRRTGAISPKPLELPVWLEDLKKERKRTEYHLESIKKRQANLNTSSEAMKQQVQECFEELLMALQRDEKAVLDMIEQDRRETSSKLNRILQDWNQHLGLLQKHISTIQSAQQSSAESMKQPFPEDFTSCHKKLDPAEEEIKMNEERIQKLMKVLRNISKDLKAQLQRKNLMLDSSNVVFDKRTCHKQIKVTSEGRGLCLSSEDCNIPNDPQRFDQLYCALGTVAVKSGQHYWEVDVHCCSSWAVGMAYGSLQRRGREKGAKLGRNRCSWSLEFQDGHLTAWHNDRHVALPVTAARAAPNRVGVFVKYQKGRLVFYDAETMRTLQEFSAVFDRAHHQFTEPLYPAFRFFSPKDKGHHHMEICNLSL
ncbi:tripartite motif-containing protein 14-like isoform X1 [Carassius auratus]|uniref:Tripartite motif-containing protein 14-like isoform X1 n=1 Tax=Carassius auratus TaxID=7957 RepID=A0A6P6L1G3_CARAU|nr:tripartite motif-containing protein 14-like isoform X1 [Carassius auratus]XP_026078372.1 tripartite motif-containing protein 14-like isoform X1 [Carassius auratus]XP_026078373.1 tripartite motif-containing protein 14-like isoform X1 [Carassius auratus]XP_026078374.1 tripartite motif-containing protein 14-like isoform X1 [Carassius auratus]